MTRYRKWSTAALLGALACAAILMARSNAQDVSQTRSPSRFVKVGPYRINVDRIAYTTDDGDAIIVQFGDGAEPGLRLPADDARVLREWLDGQAQAPATGPRRAKIIKEGVDINVQHGLGPALTPPPR